MQCIHGADAICLQDVDGGPDDRSSEVDDDRIADIIEQSLLRHAILNGRECAFPLPPIECGQDFGNTDHAEAQF